MGGVGRRGILLISIQVMYMCGFAAVFLRRRSIPIFKGAAPNQYVGPSLFDKKKSAG